MPQNFGGLPERRRNIPEEAFSLVIAKGAYIHSVRLNCEWEKNVNRYLSRIIDWNNPYSEQDMKKALQNLKLSTLDFLRTYFRQIQTFHEANDSLVQLCGINDFFGNEHDFTNFLEFLEPRHIVSETIERREYGDFQTPSILSDLVCSILLKENLVGLIISLYPMLLFIRKVTTLTDTALLFGDKG